MKLKKPSVLELLVIIATTVVLFAMLLPAFMRAPSKYGPILTPPGVPTALRQVQWASAEYGLREGKAPMSLDDLAGITVLTSKGEKMPFSISALEWELGTNASAVQFFPEFRALDFGAVTGDEIVLAYVQEFNNADFCQVIFRSGKIQRLRSLELEKKIEQLKKLLEKARRESGANKQG